MYGGAVSWSSDKQPTTVVLTMDVEYQACGAAAREGGWLIKVLKDLASLFVLLSGREGGAEGIETQLAILQGITWWVVSCDLCIVSLRST
jgi:hypothetical protein